MDCQAYTINLCVQDEAVSMPEGASASRSDLEVLWAVSWGMGERGGGGVSIIQSPPDTVSVCTYT